jgi:hypothetical protein
VGLIVGAVAGFRSRGGSLLTMVIFALVGGACGFVAGAALTASDRYEARVARAREAGEPAPGNAKIMLVYALWWIGAIVAVLVVGFVWVMWKSF